MEQHDQATEAARIGTIGANRMALGLPIIPDPERGDYDRVLRLERELSNLRSIFVQWVTPELLTKWAAQKATMDRLEAEAGGAGEGGG